MKKGNIVLVHTDKTISSYIKSFLNNKGYNTIVINELEEFENTLKKKKIQLLILDIYIKWYNGLQLLKRVRKKYINMPIIILGDGSTKNILKFQKYCISDYIIKPIDNQNLLRRVKESILQRNEFYLKYYHIGEMYSALNDYDIAIDSYKKSIKLNPNHLKSYIALIELYIKQNEFIKANEYLKVLSDFDSNTEVQRIKGLFHYKKGEYKKAIPYLKKTSKKYPLNISINLKLGYSYMKSNNYKKALKVFANIIKVKPNYKEAILNTLKIYKQKEDWKNLLTACRRAKKYYDNDFDINESYLLALFKMENIKQINFFLKNKQNYINSLYKFLKNDEFEYLDELLLSLDTNLFNKLVLKLLQNRDFIPLKDYFFDLFKNRNEDYMLDIAENIKNYLKETNNNQLIEVIDRILKKIL